MTEGANLGLVRRAQRGDHDAFDELVGEYGPGLYRLAVAVIGAGMAEDATQDAILRAWRELPTLRDPERFAPWARRILVNRCRDLARAERRGVRTIHLEPLGPSSLALVVPAPAPGIDRASDLAAAVERLGIDQRAVLALHYVLDLPIREVAATLEIPDGTAKSRLSAALAALRQALADREA